MESYSLQFSPSYGAELLAGFRRLRADGRMCDVVLEAGGASFPCHRPLLAASSEYFRALFGESAAERRAPAVSLPALTAAGLGAVLDFLYGGGLSLSPQTLPDVLEASRYLQVDAAVALCQRFLTDGLSARTCCALANLAERHALPEALAAANAAVARHMAALLRDDDDDDDHHHPPLRAGLLALNERSLTAALDADDMPGGVREAELLRLCLDWLGAPDDPGPRLPPLRSNLLLSRLRFGLVAADDLASLTRATPGGGGGHRALATPLIRSQVTRALEYHALGDARPVRQSAQTAVRGGGGASSSSTPNHVLLVGGAAGPEERPGRRVLALDLRTGTVRPLRSAEPLPLPGLRSHCVCCVGGFLFLIGGDQVTGGGGGGGGDDEEDEEDVGGKSVGTTTTTSNRVWRYDPRFERWDEVAPMRERRARFACCVVGGVIYAVGGRRQSDRETAAVVSASTEFYDMECGGVRTAWRRGAAAPPLLPRPLHGHAAAVLGSRIYVSGGSSDHQGAADARREGSRELLCWDCLTRGTTAAVVPRVRQSQQSSSTNAPCWEKKAPMAIGRFGHRMAAAGGRLYALLGEFEPFCDIERYEPDADRWTRLRPLLGGLAAFGYGAAATPAGTLLLCGGRRWSGGREVTVRSVREYEPERDRWREVCQLPAPLTGTECALMALPL